MTFKIPVSTLVVVYASDLRVLLLERTDYPGHWQSVTGSQEAAEPLLETATRELHEETGIRASEYGGVQDWHRSTVYEIFPRWRHRYPEGTINNTEHVFSIELPAPITVTLNPLEHTAQRWLPWREAASECFSWSNRDAIEALPARVVPNRARQRENAQ